MFYGVIQKNNAGTVFFWDTVYIKWTCETQKAIHISCMKTIENGECTHQLDQTVNTSEHNTHSALR